LTQASGIGRIPGNNGCKLLSRAELIKRIRNKICVQRATSNSNLVRQPGNSIDQYAVEVKTDEIIWMRGVEE